MNDDRFNELMRDAAETYRRPPTVDFDALWQEIERNALDARPGRPGAAPDTPTAKRTNHTAWLAIAATLVVGVAIGRASMSIGTKPSQPAAVVASAPASVAQSLPYEEETSKYLGQTAALLIALPSEVKAGRADQQFVSRANELLSRTRLLLDSPAASDPQMHDLLEDLELVLVQIVRLQNDHTSRTELDLISRALEQRDVIPRLRTAVADISAN
jgi:uncharacterized membrane-anchored protein YhcB (DUF1043 family)